MEYQEFNDLCVEHGIAEKVSFKDYQDIVEIYYTFSPETLFNDKHVFIEVFKSIGLEGIKASTIVKNFHYKKFKEIQDIVDKKRKDLRNMEEQIKDLKKQREKIDSNINEQINDLRYIRIKCGERF